MLAYQVKKENGALVGEFGRKDVALWFAREGSKRFNCALYVWHLGKTVGEFECGIGFVGDEQLRTINAERPTW